MMSGQLAQEVVNACLRARLHSLDDADIDSAPVMFVHMALLHSRPSPLSADATSGGLDVRLAPPCLQQDSCTARPASDFPSLQFSVWHETDARLAGSRTRPQASES